MKKLKKILLIIAVLLTAVSTYAIIQHKRHNALPEAWSEEGEKQPVSFRDSLKAKPGQQIPHTLIAWEDLATLDYKNGTAPDELKKLEGTTVKIPGFIVPLTDSFESFDSFLIVPDPMACIHAPAPPPNQILFVQTKKPIPINLTFYPLWFYGKLKIDKQKSFYGEVGYSLKLEKLELYEDVKYPDRVVKRRVDSTQLSPE